MTKKTNFNKRAKTFLASLGEEVKVLGELHLLFLPPPPVTKAGTGGRSSLMC
jgi:hypothetical protein